MEEISFRPHSQLSHIVLSVFLVTLALYLFDLNPESGIESFLVGICRNNIGSCLASLQMYNSLPQQLGQMVD